MGIFKDALLAQRLEFFEPPKEQPSRGTAVFFPSSDFRERISLRGEWRLSLPNGKVVPVSIPSSYRGTEILRFEKDFFLERKSEQKSLTLISEGMGNQAEIYINGQFLKLHIGNGAPFKVSIPSEFLRFGDKNTLAVVTNPALTSDGGTIPLRPQGFDERVYAGLFRPLYISIEPEMHLDEVGLETLSLDKLPNGLATVRSRLSAKIKSIPFGFGRSEFDSLKGSTVLLGLSLVKDDTIRVASFPKLYEFTVQSDWVFSLDTVLTFYAVLPWRPENPELYTVRIELTTARGSIIDQIEMNTGFSKVESKNGGFYVNGAHFELKGVTYSEGDLRAGLTLSREMVLRDLLLAKSLGVNAIRFRRMVNADWIQLSDSLGMFVLIDFPVNYVPGALLGTKKFRENAGYYQREVVKATRSHPSLFAYGFGNGIDLSNEHSAAYLEFMNHALRQFTSHLSFLTPVRFIPNHPLYDKVDFLGVAIRGGTLQQFQERLAKARESLHPEKPLIVSEYGTMIEPDNHNGYSDRNSLEYQSKYLMDRYKHLQVLNTAKEKEGLYDIAGSFIESLTDYPIEIPLLRSTEYAFPNVLSVGIVSPTRDKRDAFQTVKLLYASERVYNPPIGSKEEPFTISFIVCGLVLTLAFLYLLNSNKRIRENFPRALARPFSLYMDIRDLRVYHFDPLILNAVLSFIVSSLVVAVLYSGRQSEVVEFWLGHVIRFEWLKMTINVLIINPFYGIVVLGVFFYGLSFFIPQVILFVLYLFGKTRVKYVQMTNLCLWSSGQWFTLIFIAAFIDRLESTAFIAAVGWVVLLFVVMTWARIFKGLSVITEISRTKVTLVGIVLLVLIVGAPLYVFNYTHQSYAYFEFWRFIMR